MSSTVVRTSLTHSLDNRSVGGGEEKPLNLHPALNLSVATVATADPTQSSANMVTNQYKTPIPKTSFDKQETPANVKATPTRRAINKSKVPPRLMQRIVLERPCHHHSFLTDIADVRKMEKGLLQLLGDFHSGKLHAFGKDCTFEKMDSVREQQEKLARLHFDLNAHLENYNPLSEDGRSIAKENMAKLMENLQQLSQSIDQLHSSTSNVGLQTEV
uniref:Coiled-coil domain-containing protein 28B n=1 Tax=Strigamia maritima TaxID=126957 RepID=T1J386_STRMM